MSETMKLSSIVIGDRIRKDMGDVAALAESMKRHGLLHPIVVKRDGMLVAGYRRIEAMRLLGLDEIPVTVIDVEDLLSAERDENAERKDFTPTEAVAIGRLIEEQERPKAIEAKRQNMARTQAIRAGTVSGDSPGAIKVGETREKAARAVGMSEFTYQRAKNVVTAAEAHPDKYGDLPARMDATGQVLPVHREMERRRSNGKTGRHPVHYKTQDRKPNDAMQRAVLAFDGLCTGLRTLDIKQLDPTETKEWAKSLAKAATFLRALSRKVANVKG